MERYRSVGVALPKRKEEISMAGKSDHPSNEHTFGPDRALEDSAGAKGEDRKRAVDADRTGGGERPETVPKPDSRAGNGYDDPDRI
jgi:hypothetical protein